ncbi:MAG TPA: redoxin domain-containing protein [Paludibaculum sp.]
MESLEPKPITRTFWAVCIAVPVLAVGAMLVALMNPDWLAVTIGKGEPINASFTVPGEFSARSLSDFRGRVLVVTLWRTTDCPDCLTQMEALHTLALRYGREGLMAIMLSEQDSFTLMRFPQLRGMQIMSGHIEKPQADALPRERPYTFVIDREGLVRQRIPKAQTAEKFEGLLERLLGR